MRFSIFSGSFVLLCALAYPSVAQEPQQASEPPLNASTPSESQAGPPAASEQLPPGFPAVFFAETRPVFVRLRFTLDGRDIRDVWKENVAKTFEYLDVNKDNAIDVTESQRTPWTPVTNVRTSKVGSFFKALARNSQPKNDPAQAMDMEKFTAKYAEQRAVANARGEQSLLDNRDRGSPLWQRIDVDRNDQITDEEISHLVEVLRSLDNDGNDIISLGELSQFSNPFGNLMPQQNMATPKSPLVVIVSRDVAITVAERIQDLYFEKDNSEVDVGSTNLLSKRLAPPVIAKLDADMNGSIALEEWTNFVQEPVAEFEMTLKLFLPKMVAPSQPMPSPMPTNQDRPQLVWQRNAELGLDDFELVASLPESVTFFVGGAKLKCQADLAAAGNVSATYLQQFDFTDADNNNYLDDKEAPSNGFFASTFSQMDSNSDGKVFKEEVQAFATRIEADLQSRVEAIVYEQGKHLFPLLDVNDDQRLSQRELIAPVALSRRWDQNGDGFLQREELPPSYVARLGFGQPAAGLPFAQTVLSMDYQIQPSSAPNWFQRLDRNSDGDLSRREFPGPVARFDAMDMDHDGLISAQEAASAH